MVHRSYSSLAYHWWRAATWFSSKSTTAALVFDLLFWWPNEMPWRRLVEWNQYLAVAHHSAVRHSPDSLGGVPRVSSSSRRYGYLSTRSDLSFSDLVAAVEKSSVGCDLRDAPGDRADHGNDPVWRDHDHSQPSR